MHCDTKLKGFLNYKFALLIISILWQFAPRMGKPQQAGKGAPKAAGKNFADRLTECMQSGDLSLEATVESQMRKMKQQEARSEKTEQKRREKEIGHSWLCHEPALLHYADGTKMILDDDGQVPLLDTKTCGTKMPAT